MKQRLIFSSRNQQLCFTETHIIVYIKVEIKTDFLYEESITLVQFFTSRKKKMSGRSRVRNRLIRALTENEDNLLHIATVRLHLMIMRTTMPDIYADMLINLEVCLDHIWDIVPDKNEE